MPLPARDTEQHHSCIMALKPHDCSGLKCQNRELTIVPEEPIVSARHKKWSNKSPSSSVITSVGRNLYKFCLERPLVCLFSNVKLLSCSASVVVWVYFILLFWQSLLVLFQVTSDKTEEGNVATNFFSDQHNVGPGDIKWPSTSL